MKIKIYLFFLSFFLLITPLVLPFPVKAAPSYATIQYVENYVNKKISQLEKNFNQALQQINKTLLKLTIKTDILEQKVAGLETRVYQLENPPAPTMIPTGIPTPTPEVGLIDNFDGSSVNTQIWEVFTNSGTYNVSDGHLNIIGGSKPGMPFFRTKNKPFPLTGTFTVEFGIQYTALYPAGDGLALSIGQQPNDSTSPNISVVSLWNSNGGDDLSFRYFGNMGVKIGNNDLNYHIVKFIYDGDKYSAYLDGVLKYTSPSATRASGLWFGHPYYSDLPGWTDFKLDYVKITQP